MVILISGFTFKIAEPFRYFVIIILILNIFVFVLPIKIRDSSNSIDALNDAANFTDCNNPYTTYFLDTHYDWFNYKLAIAKTDLLRYRKSNSQKKDIPKKVFSGTNKTNITFLDLTTDNYIELDFYATIFESSKQFNYFRCFEVNDFDNFQDMNSTTLILQNFDYFLVSKNSYEYSIKFCRGCLDSNMTKYCNLLRDEVLQGYKKVDDFMVEGRHYSFVSLYKQS